MAGSREQNSQQRSESCSTPRVPRMSWIDNEPQPVTGAHSVFVPRLFASPASSPSQRSSHLSNGTRAPSPQQEGRWNVEKEEGSARAYVQDVDGSAKRTEEAEEERMIGHR